MADTISLTINNITFEYPAPGADPGWGEDATGWAEAVTEAINSLLGVGDILETTFNVGNDVSVAEEVTGLAFNTSTVRAATIDYSIYRTSDANPSGNAETGSITIVFDDNAPATEKWIMVQKADGDAGVEFFISDAGQFSYTSTDIDSTNYSGILKFKARTLAQ